MTSTEFFEEKKEVRSKKPEVKKSVDEKESGKTFTAGDSIEFDL